MAKRKTHHEVVAYSGELTDVLKDVVRDNLSPEAVAAIAGLIENEDVAGTVGKEVQWFRRQLIDLLGGTDAWWNLWLQLTVQ